MKKVDSEENSERVWMNMVGGVMVEAADSSILKILVKHENDNY